MSGTSPFLIVVGMTLVTQIPRVLPLILFGNKPLPEGLRHWLAYVPASIICAMLATQLFVSNGHVSFTENKAFILAAIPSLFIAVTARNILVSVLTGLVSVALLRLML